MAKKNVKKMIVIIPSEKLDDKTALKVKHEVDETRKVGGVLILPAGWTAQEFDCGPVV